MFVITNQLTFRVCRQSGLTSTRQTEEDSRVSTFHVRVSRTVHRSNTFQRVQVVHDREDTLLHFTTVPCIQNNLFICLQVEYCSSFRVQAQFLVVLNFSLSSVERYEIRFTVVGQFFFSRTDEHVLHKVSLPCYFHDETHFQTSSRVCTTESIHYEQTFAAQLFHSFSLQVSPSFFRTRFVVVLVFIRSPPYCIFASFIVNKEFIFRRTSSINTSHYVHSIQFCYLTFFEAFQTSFGFFSEQYFV
ncbi:hypothetical protein EVA_02703 [gut metagenome]|uniref:Uncharacterized protein n=1 Tax=gut metagenome TaxID=749906 RepID=J9H0N9_9ZZZZ